MISVMQRRFFSVILVICGVLLGLCGGAGAQGNLGAKLGQSYGLWRKAMVEKDARLWRDMTARHRQLEIRNRIYSERRGFPSSVFDVPGSPPSVQGLKLLRARQKGPTATAVYFGKVDFGVGGTPEDNLLLLYFVNERGRWLYDKAEYLNLGALPDVRKKLKAGDLAYVDQKDFLPSGKVPPMPIAVGRAKYIAKVYVYCPGREVKVKVNLISDHRFQNTTDAEVVIGGAKDGRNEVQFATKLLEGGKESSPVSIRVYLMSTIPGTKPIKAFEYQVKEGGEVKPFGSGHFLVTPEIAAKLVR